MTHQATVQRDRGGSVAELSDETLMAFADKQLDAAERQRVSAILADNPELMERVRKFEETGASLGKVYNTLIESPVPASLVDYVRRLPVGEQSAVTDLAAARRARESAPRNVTPVSRSGWQPVALAASICLAVGGAAGWLAHGTFDTPSAKAAALLQVALETVPGGSEAVMPVGGNDFIRVMPAVTFRDKDRQFCRQYLVSGAVKAATEGVACRAADGGWNVKLELAKAPARTGLGTATGAKSAGVGALIEQIMDGDEVTAAEQRRLIDSKWQSRR